MGFERAVGIGDLEALLMRVGDGDVAAFARLYDRLASASYAVCTRLAEPKQDAAMHKTWLYIWANAASLRALQMPARVLVLNVAREMSSKAS